MELIPLPRWNIGILLTRLMVFVFVYEMSYSLPAQVTDENELSIILEENIQSDKDTKQDLDIFKNNISSRLKFTDKTFLAELRNKDSNIIRSLLSRKSCHSRDFQELEKMLTEGRKGISGINIIRKILSKMGKNTIMCKVRHMKGVKLVSNIRSLYPNLSKRDAFFLRKGELGSSHYLCRENVTKLNDNGYINYLRKDMKAKGCLDETADKYISRILQLGEMDSSGERSFQKRLKRLQCQLAKKYRFCEKRMEISSTVKPTDRPQFEQMDLGFEEAPFLKNWPDQYELARDDLEMIFY